jgi:hypothetical protein
VFKLIKLGRLVMKLREFGSIIFIVIILASAGYAVLHKVKPDLVKPENAIEEFLEDRLCEQLGLEDGAIDLTPSSPEK